MAPKRNTKTVVAPEAAAEVTEPQSHADSLLVALHSGVAVPSIVDSILQLYRDDDPNIALAAIINAISKAAGVQGTAEVPAATVRDETAVASTLEELFARVPVDSGAYFLVNKDVKYKRFRKTFPEFFERLVQSSFAAGFLFDDVLMTTVLQWLFAMSESKARSFRHTSTVAVLAVISGLNDQIRMLGETIQTLKKKDAAAKQADYEKLVKLQEHVFTIVVHQRAKDIAPEIRLSVVQALRQWFLSSSEIYLSNKYLRYLSISLHDKKPELRAEALEILIQILGNRPTDAPRLREFLKHYANRLLEMVNDVETRVADLAIKLVALVIRADTDAGNSDDANSTFNNNMIDHVLLSLFDERGIIRAAAGTFLKVFIRCRLADDSEKTSRARTELLCTFASIFREVHREPNPEKYLVDALWRDDSPPSMLTNYGPILALLTAAADSEEGEEKQIVVSLSFVAALLQRMKGPLSFGPVAKDDLKVPIGKVDAQRMNDTAELRITLSKAVGMKLDAVLAKHGQNSNVVVSVAKVFAHIELNAFTTSKESHQLAETIEAFRAATAFVCLTTDDDVADVADAWYALAFSEHKLKNDAERHLHELLKVILKQLSTKGGADSDAWARVRMLSRLVSLKNQWVVFLPALGRHIAAPESSPSALKHLLAVTFQSVLWNMGEMTVDPSIKPDAVKEQIAEVVELYLQLCKPSEDEFGAVADENPEVLAARALAFGCLCDLMALPIAPALSQLQQEELVEAAFVLVDRYNEAIKKDTEALKSFGKKKGDSSSEFTSLLFHRRCIAVSEAAVSQIVVGLVRLFTYDTMDKKLAASALLLWTRVSVKAAADVFKTMFHNTRENMKDSYQLERDILDAAYKQCSAQGSNAIALENLYQVGVKLSSMHFLLTDRFYPACVSIVRFGVNFAVTIDPAMLQAITPYCSRLKQSDALTIANSLKQHDIFVTESVNPFVRSFTSAIRRAARLEDPGASVAPTAPSVGRAVSKRPREVVSSSAPRGTFEADDILSEIVRSNKRPAPPAAKGRAGSSTAAATSSGRQVTKDGWRVAAGSSGRTPVASQSSQASAGYVPQTQESVLSSFMGDVEDEVFIATQEYE